MSDSVACPKCGATSMVLVHTVTGDEYRQCSGSHRFLCTRLNVRALASQAACQCCGKVWGKGQARHYQARGYSVQCVAAKPCAARMRARLGLWRAMRQAAARALTL